MKFYIDMDDTVADFRAHAIASGVPPWSGTWYTQPRETWTQEQCDIQDRTNEIMLDPSFWLTMPVMDGAFELVAACAARGETFFLSAYPRTCPDRAMVERVKKTWADVRMHFPPERVIVCNREDKIKYATRRIEIAVDEFGTYPNLLIDDAEKNCDEWTAAGGHSILYRHGQHLPAIEHMRVLVSGR